MRWLFRPRKMTDQVVIITGRQHQLIFRVTVYCFIQSINAGFLCIQVAEYIITLLPFTPLNRLRKIGCYAAACYYDASSATDLANALDDILSQVSSCTYDIPPFPAGLQNVGVYFDDGSDPPAPELLQPGLNWRYDENLHQIEIIGSACTTIQSGAVIPLIAYTCEFTPG